VVLSSWINIKIEKEGKIEGSHSQKIIKKSNNNNNNNNKKDEIKCDKITCIM